VCKFATKIILFQEALLSQKAKNIIVQVFGQNPPTFMWHISQTIF
jgi:hypothetical protein